MIVCKKCGWEIKEDFGLWQDMYDGLVCDWVGDVPRPHKPRREVRTPNNSELAVA
jgi:hypothetical protein